MLKYKKQSQNLQLILFSCSFFCLWSDTDAWAKSGWLRKLLNFVIVALLFVLWPFVILRVYRDFAELSIPRVAEAISVGVGGALTMLSSLRMATERDTLTQAVRAVDEKVLAVPKDTPRWEKWWQETRRNYVTEGRILLVGCLLPLAVGIPQLVYMVRTGRLYFDSAIPLSDESYSWQWWLQAVYQSCNPTGACFLYSLKEFLWLDTYYHLSMLFRVQAETVMELCLEENFDPVEEYQKLRGVVLEISALKEWVIYMREDS